MVRGSKICLFVLLACYFENGTQAKDVPYLRCLNPKPLRLQLPTSVFDRTRLIPIDKGEKPIPIAGPLAPEKVETKITVGSAKILNETSSGNVRPSGQLSPEEVILYIQDTQKAKEASVTGQNPSMTQIPLIKELNVHLQPVRQVRSTETQTESAQSAVGH